MTIISYDNFSIAIIVSARNIIDNLKSLGLAFIRFESAQARSKVLVSFILIINIHSIYLFVQLTLIEEENDFVETLEEVLVVVAEILKIISYNSCIHYILDKPTTTTNS